MASWPSTLTWGSLARCPLQVQLGLHSRHKGSRIHKLGSLQQPTHEPPVRRALYCPVPESSSTLPAVSPSLSPSRMPGPDPRLQLPVLHGSLPPRVRVRSEPFPISPRSAQHWTPIGLMHPPSPSPSAVNIHHHPGTPSLCLIPSSDTLAASGTPERQWRARSNLCLCG